MPHLSPMWSHLLAAAGPAVLLGACSSMTGAGGLFVVGGRVAGVSGALVLENALGDGSRDTLLLTSDGEFAFPIQVPDGTGFAVTIGQQPAGQTCEVIHGTGEIDSRDVTDIAVTCRTVRPASVAVAPTRASLRPSGTRRFAATVTGVTDTSVRWFVTEANGGAVDAAGLYTAPAAAGTFHVTVASVADPSKSAVATIEVAAAPAPLAVTTTTLPDALVGSAYEATLEATGGDSPYSWSVSSGSLPSGLALDSSTGTIAGAATGAASSSFTVRVTDAAAAQATKTIAITVRAADPGVTWHSCSPYTAYKAEGFIFNNQRWNGEAGCIDVDTRGGISWWTTHSNFENCCSSPWVSIGYVANGGEHADNPFGNSPPRIQDIEVLKANWRFTVPTPLDPGYATQAFHVYFQLYFGNAPGESHDAGDMALVMYDSFFYCQPNCPGTKVTIGNRPMAAQYKGSAGFGPFWVMVGSGSPDSAGMVEVRDFDIKAAIDYAVSQGSYSKTLYVNQVSAAFEVMTLPGGTLKTNDLSFLIKLSGQDAFYLPSSVPPTWAPQ